MKKKKHNKLIVVAILAVLTIGDGVMGALFSKGYMRTMRIGPSFFRKMADYFIKRPWLTRLIGIVETAAGIWLGSNVRLQK